MGFLRHSVNPNCPIVRCCRNGRCFGRFLHGRSKLTGATPFCLLHPGAPGPPPPDFNHSPPKTPLPGCPAPASHFADPMPPAPSRIRVLIADDHHIVRLGLEGLISGQTDMEVVGTAGDGREAMSLHLKRKPDIVLMDLHLPDMSGIDCCAAIHSRSPHTRIVILTIHGGDRYLAMAFEAGASAYLFKAAQPDELLNTIRALHAGYYQIPTSIARELAVGQDPANLPGELSLKILRLVSLGCGNKEIAQQLALTDSTVKGHLSKILNQLGAKDRTEAVTIALRRGLLPSL